MVNIKDFLNEQDQFARQNGMRITEAVPGEAEARMTIEERHLNGVRTVQGGAIFTLADLAFAAASNAAGTVAVAANVSISFLKAARSGTLTAKAKEIPGGKKLAAYTVTVTDDAGDMVAIFQGLAYRKADKIGV